MQESPHRRVFLVSVVVSVGSELSGNNLRQIAIVSSDLSADNNEFMSCK